MITVRCDGCERSQPDVNCRYSFRKSWQWWRYDYDSQGGSHSKLDLCERCWDKLQNIKKEVK